MKYILLLVLIFASCKNKKEEILDDSILLNEKELIIGRGQSKDSLEVGRWSYRKEGRLSKKGRYEDGYKIGNWSYYNNDTIFNIDWAIYQDKIIKANYPKKWLVKDNSNYLFYALPDDKNDFFLITRHNKKTNNLELKDYLKKVFIEIKNKEKEKLINYNLLKLEYKKRIAYYFNFTTKQGQEHYTYYTFYTEDDEFVYDFTFKLRNKNNLIYDNIFGGIVYSFSIEDEKFFYNRDEMINSYKIKIEDVE